jgi:hypothetical protein
MTDGDGKRDCLRAARARRTRSSLQSMRARALFFADTHDKTVLVLRDLSRCVRCAKCLPPRPTRTPPQSRCHAEKSSIQLFTMHSSNRRHRSGNAQLAQRVPPLPALRLDPMMIPPRYPAGRSSGHSRT